MQLGGSMADEAELGAEVNDIIFNKDDNVHSPAIISMVKRKL